MAPVKTEVVKDSTGVSQQYGFVNFESPPDAADKAVERVHGMQIGDQIVEVVLLVRLLIFQGSACG